MSKRPEKVLLKVCLDSFFSSVRLAKILKNMFIGFTGRIKNNRKEKALLPDVRNGKQPFGTYASCINRNAKVLLAF